MGDEFASGIAIGLLIGVLAGIPLGWIIAQYAGGAGDSIVALERDANGNISAIVEKQIR
jgi:hypothetical protein